MVKVSIQVTTQIPSGTTKQVDKITYVNPEATNATLKQFAQQLASLSENRYLSTTKITEEAI